MFFPNPTPARPFRPILLQLSPQRRSVKIHFSHRRRSRRSSSSHDKKGSLAQESRRNFLRWNGFQVPRELTPRFPEASSEAADKGTSPTRGTVRCGLEILSRPKISAKSCVEKPRAKSLFLEQPRECVRVCLCT